MGIIGVDVMRSINGGLPSPPPRRNGSSASSNSSNSSNSSSSASSSSSLSTDEHRATTRCFKWPSNNSKTTATETVHSSRHTHTRTVSHEDDEKMEMQPPEERRGSLFKCRSPYHHITNSQFGDLHRAMKNARTNSELTSLKRIVQKGQIPDKDWPKGRGRRRRRGRQKGVTTFGSQKMDAKEKEKMADRAWRHSGNRIMDTDDEELAGKLQVLRGAVRREDESDTESDFDRQRSVF